MCCNCTHNRSPSIAGFGRIRQVHGVAQSASTAPKTLLFIVRWMNTHITTVDAALREALFRTFITPTALQGQSPLGPLYHRPATTALARERFAALQLAGRRRAQRTQQQIAFALAPYITADEALSCGLRRKGCRPLSVRAPSIAPSHAQARRLHSLPRHRTPVRAVQHRRAAAVSTVSPAHPRPRSRAGVFCDNTAVGTSAARGDTRPVERRC